MLDSTPQPAVRAVPARVSAGELARRIAATAAPWFWFDGEADSSGEPRVSSLGLASEVRRAVRGEEQEFLSLLRASTFAQSRDAAEAPDPRVSAGVSAGFGGGWVVALSYEFGVGLLGITAGGNNELGIEHEPEPASAIALWCDVVVAMNHDSGVVELRGPSDAAIDAWLVDHGELLRGDADPEPPVDVAPHTDQADPADSADLADPADPSAAPRWRRDDAEYASAVERCRSAIREGDAYVLCLTDTAEVRGEFDAIEVYGRLRAAGVPIRGGIIDAGSRVLVSASPERFLSVRGDRVATHPIKGTRRRSAVSADDRALAVELGADPKERAENLMIVDLMRNDLSRVCEPGSVRVERFLAVETHAHVHQLVSTVAGTLAAGIDVWDAVGAAFPGGSMTGAPKRRAVQLLAPIEGGPRGLYAGCFGWIDRGGDAELAMTIRSVELRRGDRPCAHVGAGGGVTIDSIPEREVAEKHLKAAALFDALAPQPA